MKKIEFNVPYVTGKESTYLSEVTDIRKLSGDGKFTRLCNLFFKDKFNFDSVFLTTSCTDALEMSAILSGISYGDEVIAPSYTFVSTVNAFVLRGAKIVFIDSQKNNPNMDIDLIESKINEKTKAIIAVHYAGIACDMERIMAIAVKYNLFVIEDAAQAINSFYKGKPLGSIGHFGAFSFHETKNIISGEGGLIVINDENFIKRAEIIREKGTNRSSFFRGEVDKYNWIDIGSSFLPSELISAFLYAQLQELEHIQSIRVKLWNRYENKLKSIAKKGYLQLPEIPSFATNNAHMFYVICENLVVRTELIDYLKSKDIFTVFHYISLHRSEFYSKQYPNQIDFLPNSDKFSDCLIRLPMHCLLEDEDIDRVCFEINNFFTNK
jgi:dTDP-4-amino-4,6-dideoxygalactose transaminase